MTVAADMIIETAAAGDRTAFVIDAAIQVALNRAAQRRADNRAAVDDLAEALAHSRRATAQARADARRLREDRDSWQREAAAAGERVDALQAALLRAAALIAEQRA